MASICLPRVIITAFLLQFAGLAAGACEKWCLDSCAVLNGPLYMECNDCSADEGYQCYPGAPDYDTWQERHAARKAQQGSAGGAGKGNAAGAGGGNPDVVELTHKSMVYRTHFFEIATPKRDVAMLENQAFSEFVVRHSIPKRSPRNCTVHSCELIEGDEPCAQCTSPPCAGCNKPRGHLRPFGEQHETTVPVTEYDVASKPLDAPTFWREHISPYEPVLLRGGAAAITDLAGWSDEALRGSLENGHAKCARPDGKPWTVIVEQNNRISHNDRHPLVSGWSFCHYLNEYRKPDAPTYCINSLTDDRDLPLARALGLPEMMACDELYESMHAVRMWMSRGNTTSSQHFDTHDNILFQIDGSKDIFLSHPNESGSMYMDHHDKFGLSPINVDRVDLDRFPDFPTGRMYHARLQAGDALYIPDSWWHVIHSTGRNIALAFEFVVHRNVPKPWTKQLNELYQHPGLYLAEKRCLHATMTESYARAALAGESPTKHLDGQCTAPLAADKRPRHLAEYTGWHSRGH